MYEKGSHTTSQEAPSDPLPKAGALKSLSLFTPYIRRYPGHLALLAGAILLASSSVLLFGHALGALINDGLKNNGSLFLGYGILLLLGLVSFLALGSYLRLKSITFLGESIVAELKKDCFDRLMHQPYPFFEKNKTGDLLSRLTSDTLLIQLLISNSAPIALRNIVLMTGGIIMLFITSAKLAAYVFLLAPLIIVFISLLGKTVKSRSKHVQENMAQLNILTEESLTAIREIQAFNQEHNKALLFHALTQGVVTQALSHMRARSRLIVSVMILVFSFIAFLLWKGGQGVLDGAISPGSLASFVFYALLVASSVNSFSEIVTDIQRSAGAADRLKDLLDLPLPPLQKNSDKAPTPFSTALSFQDASFSYPSRPHQDTLSELSLTFKKGTFTAIVGPSGSGKTTLFQLLLGFYAPQKGGIYIDQTPYSALSDKTVRSYFGYVPQDPHMFSGTLKDNLLFGCTEASEESLNDALKKAHLDHFVQELKEGLETRVGEKGIRLSGGQKQRIALARAFLKKAPILLLDEPTSALDSQSEQFIQNSLDTLKQQGTTILVIAHRLSTIQKADTIYVLDKGRCVQEGIHTTLLKKPGLYADLAKIQFDSPA